jgi:hypothetical protein
MQSFFIQKKTLIIEVLVLALFLGGSLYLYMALGGEETATVTTASYNEQLLGQNSVLFLKTMNQDKISFTSSDLSLIRPSSSPIVARLKDRTQTVDINPERGRNDPFAPYASSRPIR